MYLNYIHMRSSFIPILLLFSIFIPGLNAQVAINDDGSAPDASAALDIDYTTKGILPPRMTAVQRIAITSPAAGLVVYQTDLASGIYYFTGTQWVNLIDSEMTSGCTDYEGTVYPTFRIGNMEWMAENLRVYHYNNGDQIDNVVDNTAWSNLTTGAWVWYNNDYQNYGDYGNLYNWYAVMDSRKICPAGWHVPSDAEWIALSNAIGGDYFSGGKLKSVSGLWNTPNTGATNSSGFSGLPGGLRVETGSYMNAGHSGYWWTTHEVSTSFARYRYMVYNSKGLGTNHYYKTWGLHVRCVRD